MTDLLRSVVTVIDVFYKYTNQDGECGTLSKDELKELLEKEFRPILKNPDDPDTVDVIMHMLDRDHDRRLDFTEFLLMVFKLAMACNKVLSKEYCKASGSKKHRRGHRHHKEESETEEDEEDAPEQKSGYRHSNWREGEEYGYGSEGLRRSVKHRHGSNSRRLGRQDQKLLTDSKDTPLDKHILVLDRPPGQNLAGPKEAGPVPVNRVTGKGTQDSHRHTQSPLMSRRDLNMESWDPPGKEDRELLTDSKETPLDMHCLVMDRPPGQNPVGLGEENPVSVSPVTVKGTQESHSHRQGPLMAMLDLNMESRDPPGKEDRELLTDRQETPLDIPSPLMDKPPGQNPVGLEERDLV
ncbi:uncharacterized protein LOC121021080 isoform X2 [Herpailurus yagouaroundi]|uniref:uncharacterized protein LOC121021080 isoform X1 n=1 Tax=Herpailurus yagouaroundi TaxID=1608482 RepID=UPI001AD77AC0|nr:uncharacterized protein LOC121021080 isoform X1 [Puma yagouaroundi]XP_040317213.1 uncharacterized protein LOC121021080 isoform X2 [Puma yagouaroundi]